MAAKTMNDNDFLQFYDELSKARSLLGQEPLSDDGILAFFNLIKDEGSIEDFSRALTKHLKTSRFAPTPADIITLMKADNPETDIAAQQWTQVVGAVQFHGPRAVAFEYIKTSIAVNKMGGYMYLDEVLTEDNEPFFRKEFIEKFNSINDVSKYPTSMKFCPNGREPYVAIVSPYYKDKLVARVARKKLQDIEKEIADHPTAEKIRTPDFTPQINYVLPPVKKPCPELECCWGDKAYEYAKKCEAEGKNWIEDRLNAIQESRKKIEKEWEQKEKARRESIKSSNK